MKRDVLHLVLRRAQVDPNAPADCLSDSNEVVVHYYDLRASFRFWNSLTTRLGVFHTGVEVYGREWCFCASSELPGVIATVPKQHPNHRYRGSVRLGATGVT